MSQTQNAPTKTDTAAQTKNADVITQLRSQTQGEHRRVEEIPFNERIMDEAITLDEYARLLSCHLIIHEALEEALALHDDPRVGEVFQKQQIKAPALAADIKTCTDLGARAVLLDDDAIRRARDLARAIQWLSDDAACALGFFYVFEGSTMGAMVLRKKISAALDLDVDGLRFFTGYGRMTAPTWRDTCQRFNAVDLNEAEKGRAVAAANLAFLEIGHILSAF